jgi:NADPH-dependent ferric siderophore reductase
MSIEPMAAVPQHQTDPRTPQRVRHQPRRRMLEVKQVDKISAHMIRVTLGGDLEGFTSLGFDDHVKLFFPTGSLGEDGQPELMARDYTPRRYDPQANTLAIEFVIHDAGPATRWAEQAKPGDALQIGGPRGSFVIPTEFDWHLLIGDDTGLPAIARRLEELPAGTRAVALVEVDGPADRVRIESPADVTLDWVYRNGAEAGSPDFLSQALRRQKLPRGNYYAWAACESLTAKALRAQLIAEHGANPKWIRAAGYGRRGAVAVHDVIND